MSKLTIDWKTEKNKIKILHMSTNITYTTQTAFGLTTSHVNGAGGYEEQFYVTRSVG